MNKIYKVIWNRVRHCYVVVSEITKNHGKEHSTNLCVSKRLVALTLAIGLSLSSYAFVAAEDNTTPGVQLGNGAAATYDNHGNLVIGNKKTVAEGSKQAGEHNTTIGTDSDTLRNVTEGDTKKDGQPLDGSNTKLVDGEGKAHPLDLSTEAGGSTAVGYQTHNEGDNSTAIGNNAKITNKPVTYYVDADGKKTAFPENAVWYKDASGKPTKVPQVFRDADGNTTATPQYIHTYTEKDSTTGEDVTKTEITSDAAKADKDSAGNLVYNYKKKDNTDKLYSVTLYQAASNSIAAGTDVTANGSNAVAVGYSSSADNSAVAIGDTATAKENAVAIGKGTKASVEGSIALGKESEADRSGGVTGWDPKTGTASTKTDVAWKSGEGALSIGNGGASRQITNVAAGSEDSDAVNLAQLKNAMTHYYSVNTTPDTDAAGNNNYLNDGATGDNALAAGVSAVATGDNATAVGTNTYASGTNASAYGYRAVASGSGSVAIGSGTSAQQEGSVAIGGHTQGAHAVQVGTDSTAQSAYSVAVGGHAEGDHSVEVGYGFTAQGSYSASVGGHAIGNNSVAIGTYTSYGRNNAATAGGANSIAIGGHTSSTNDIAIGAGSSTSGGQAITVGGSATGQQAVSIGGVAGNSQATAVGSNSSATGAYSTAVGGHAGDTNSTAVGQGANATYAYATAVGNSSTASGDHSTALGYGTSAQGSSTTAIGGANANGTNLTVIGNGSTASSSSWYGDAISNSTAIGGAHISASDAAAIGSNATVNGKYGVALGHNSNVSTSSTGVGEGTKASNTGTAVGYGAQSSGYQSAAVGAGSNATGQNAVSLGGGGAWGDYSIALGSGAGTTTHAIALGQNSGAWGENAIAIGEGTNAWRANSIVLGKNSKSGADKNIAGYDPRTGVASVDDTSTWYSTDEAVSIGRAEERDDEDNITVSAITRQLNNLAAGTLDTDAVNVAQLKAATQKVNMHDYSVWSPDTETDTNYTNGGAMAKNSMAAGVSASTTKDAENAVAIGYGAQAEGKGATVIGQYGKATGRYALAFGGQQTDTTAEQADNVASGDNALSFGERTTASGTNSTAFGWQTTAKEKRATAFGERTTASGANATAFGQLATASGQNSVAFGNEAVANNYGSTAFGNRTEALGEYSTAFGNSTVAAGMNTAAFGTDNVAGAVLDENGAYTNIIYQTNTKNGRVVKDKNGNPIELSREKMDARGNLAYTDNNGSTKSVTYTVSGGETHSYVLLQGEDGNTYIRDYRGNIRSAVIGDDGTVTVGDKPLTDVNLKQANAGANGYHILSNANATVWGENSIASGEASTAFGVGSIAAAQNSLAALGGTVAESATNAAAIGSGAKATLEDSVALGSGAVADRKSGAKGYDMLTKGNTTNTSTAWVSNANAIAVGNGSTLTRQITGVAAGSQDTDAVNVAQLKAAGFKVTTQNNGSISSSILNGDTLDFEGKDNAIVSTSKDSKTITVAVSKTPTFDSATFYNPNPSEGQNNEKVTISNGHISTYNKDQQERAVLGTDNQGSGTLHLINNDLSQVHVYTQNSKDDGNDGITRMYYISSSGNGGEIQGIHTIAVLDDGINYAGDNVKPNTSEKVVVKHKLNSTMDITGGADTNNLAGGNIGVVATPAVEDDQGNITQKAKLELKLNKDLTGLNTVTAGTAKIGHTDAGKLKTTQNGAETGEYADAGDYVTGLTNKDWTTNNPTYVSGRAATEDELATVSGDVTTNANNITTNANNITTNADTIAKGLSFTTNTQDATNTTDNYKGYKVVNRKLGDTIAIKAGDADPSRHYATTNLTTKIADNGNITIEMDESPTFTEVTASSFNLSPKDTTTKDKAGNTASAQLNAHYRDASLNPDKNVTMADGSTGMVRLHYHDGEGNIHDLATMDDGQIYAGDIQENGTLDTTGFGRKMNEKTTINGGVTDKDKLTDNNIGVVSNGTDTLTVKLAKDLKDLNSVTTGKTVMNDNGLTIRKSDDDSSKNVVVLGDKVAFGDNQVNNMGSGASKITEDDKGNKTYEYDTLNNGANIGDVKNIASSTVQPVIDTVNKGWELDVNSTKQKAVTPDSPKVNLIQGQNITIAGDAANTDNVTIATADDVRFNTVRVGGVKSGDTYSGGILIGTQSGKNADGTESANSNDDYYITGLKNTNWDSNKIQHGRAATEDQLQAVATEIKNGTVKGDVFVTGGSVSYNGEGTNTNPKDGKGSINLTRQKGTDVQIDGLHDYYVTGGTVSNDGKTLELTRNDVDDSGRPQKITVDLGNVLSNDQHLVANPVAGSDGKYKVDTTTGTVTLKVQNPNSADGSGYSDITIGGFEGLGQGLKFGANKMAKDGGDNPVTNQLGSTIKITGAGTKELKDYSGKNLLTSVEQDDQGNTIVHVLMDKNISADGVTVGQAGKDGVAGADGEVGQAGTIGINGKNGVAGTDGKQGITTTIIRTEKGQVGKDGEIGQQGAPGVDSKDITRIVYQNDQDKVDGKDGSHTVATLDDGLKFSGDDNKVITRKLNEQLQFVGGADKNKLTENNIGINEKDGKLTIQLVNTPNLGKNGNLTAGKAQIGWFAGDTLTMTKDGTNPSNNKAGAGSYATGLSNKDWNVDNPEYVSGRAATEDQLKKVSDAIGKQVAAKSDYQLVKNDNTTDGSYTPDDGTLTLQVKDPNNADAAPKSITIKDIASKSKVDEALDRTVKYDMKDGKVDKTHVTFEATDEKGNPVDTQVSHMASGASEIKDDGKGNKTYIYNTNNNAANIGDVKNIANSLDAEVTKKGLNFKGNDGQEVHRDLGATLNIIGGINDQKALDKTNGTTSSKNLGVRSNKDGDGLEIVMTDTPDFTKVTVGEGTDMTKKITIGKQTVTGTKPDGSTADQSQTGNYITGLDNKAWDKDNVVENRAATEGQLRDAINSVNGSVDKGFGLADEAGTTVTKKLGDTITVKGDTVYTADGKVAKDGNIKTTAKDGAIQISLNDQISVGQKGADGQDGKDGKVTVETKGGTTVIIGHDGKDGEDGKDGLFVTGKDGADGKSGVSITGPDGVAGKDGVDGKVGIAGKDGKDAVSITGKDGVGHIGLTGPKGEKGADGTPVRDGTSIDILTDYGTKTLDSNKNVTVDNKEQASRIIYNDAKGPHEVATMDDGLKIGANAAAKDNAANPVSNKLNSTINIKGSEAKANHTYTDDNLTTTVEQDADGNTTVKVLMDQDITGNSVTVGKDGKVGYDGQEGSIGIAGKDGKQGITTTIIKTEKGLGKDGEVGKQGAPGIDGKDITRIVYQNGQDGENGQGGKHVVATLDDGLKFIGDDGTATPVTKKLNDTLQIRGDGTYDATTKTNNGNIQTSVESGTIKVALNKDINLKQTGSLTVGGDTQDGSTDSKDPIVIKHFDDKTLDVITGVDENGKPITAKEGKAGDYVTGLDNKDWNVDSPTYVSGRAATEDQLKKVSDAVNSAAATAGKHTVVTVNDKNNNETKAEAGTGAFGNYAGADKGNLLIAAKNDNGQMTYNIKLNDQLAIGQKGEPGVAGKDGKDGKVTVETKGGITVVIGHDGEPGKDGKDGLFVTGKDGADGVSITGPNGADGVDGKVGIAGTNGKDAVSISGKDGVGHIGLTGPKGEPGKNGISIDISTKLGQSTLDPTKNEQSKAQDKVDSADKASRIQYESTVTAEDGTTKTITHEVATMDDGLKFVGNDGKEVTRKLNSTLSITGGMDKDAVTTASSKNLGVRSNKDGDGLEIVMTDTPDFTKVTVGEGTDPNSKITIGKQTVTGKKSDGTAGTAETGKYITGLDNTKWNKDNVVENRAATEGQLRDIAGSITNQNQGGGFALTSDEKGADKIVKQDLGKAIQIKGDTTYKADGSVEKAGNIKTSIDNGAIKVELNKNVDLGNDGSVKAGKTTINQDGVDTNKVTIKDSSISISKDGINGGSKQITNVASGASEIIKGEGGKDVYKYDNDTNAANIGDVKRIAGDMKTEINNNISNVTNKVDQIGQHVDNIQKDVTQLKTDVKADRTYQGDDGAAKKVKVKFGSFLSLTGGAKLADLTEEGNIGVVQKEIDDQDHKGEKITGLSVRLAKHLNLEKTTYTSNENGQTYTSEIDGKGLTIKTGDENRNITVQDGNVNMGGNQIHNVAPGQAPGDAVNVSQLNATNYAVNKLGTRVNRVGAGAAALAALHPLDFDPDDKWDFAAGYGNYKDASAVAVGAYYRPNEDTMFNIGGSFGGGENMVNAGVSFKVGQGNHVSTSRVAMAKEIKDLRQNVANLNAIVNRQSALIDKLTGTNAGMIKDKGNDLFPDVPANHWAYEYVTKLKQAGILTGYPDGNFDGDRMMTRYEFAAIVYRAIMAGAASNPALNQDGTLDKLANEFSSEMKYIRIDTIAKDKNGKPTIERVRVIPDTQHDVQS
ncbi:ESPR-type extended signal peptide-containing protein [Megasphaera elsdenii]|uniref:ESPR-type extended signal peptide-containing protein n=1 Tax=Megasphaera elsdenii TaxID=907 RepID=UPI0039F58564